MGSFPTTSPLQRLAEPGRFLQDFLVLQTARCPSLPFARLWKVAQMLPAVPEVARSAANRTGTWWCELRSRHLTTCALHGDISATANILGLVGTPSHPAIVPNS